MQALNQHSRRRGFSEIFCHWQSFVFCGSRFKESTFLLTESDVKISECAYKIPQHFYCLDFSKSLFRALGHVFSEHASSPQSKMLAGNE